MRVSILRTVLAVLAFALGGECLAVTGAMRIGRVELYPTWSAVGIEVSYAGDEEEKSNASFTWRREGEDKWLNGVDMTFDRRKKLIWASIWPLEQGEAIEVKIDFTDPRIETFDPYQGVVTTKVMVLVGAPGAKNYYVAPGGSDFGPGTKALPFRTLRHAASIAAPGETVYAMTGVYREGNLFSNISGAPGSPIIIAAADGEHPILDGSMEIKKGTDRWQTVGEGVFALDLPTPPGLIIYMAQDGKRVFHYRSREKMAEDISKIYGGEEFTVHAGWFYDRDEEKLYVRYRDGSKPSEHTFNLAVFDYGVLLSNSHDVVVRGFEMRYYGHSCVRVSGGSTNCVVFRNDLHNSQSGVFIFGEDTHDVAVWNNRIHEDGLREYSWYMNKGSGDQRQGITGWIGYKKWAGYDQGRMGRGMSFCHNDISGWFDGIMPGGWTRTDRLDLSRDMDIMYNHITDIGDDAIEIDSGGVNQRIHGNTVRNAFAAFALAGVEKGPVYFTRNDATFFVIGFKLNVGGPESVGWAYCYHNSLYCLSYGDEYGGTGISFPPGKTMPIANKSFKNNAFIVDGMGIRFGEDIFDLDYNCYWNVPDQEPVNFRWDYLRPSGEWEVVTYYSIEDLRENTGKETHGLFADPKYRATPSLAGFFRGNYGPIPFTDFLAAAPEGYNADFTLQPSSPCIDSGVVIRGINEDYSGAAPDMGAHEFDAGAK